MNVRQTIAATALITAITLLSACTNADAPTSDQGSKATQGLFNSKIDFYRAEGLPELYGNICKETDRPVIGIEYTHSVIKGKDWRGSGDATKKFIQGRGKYGEDLQHGSSSDYDENWLIAYDYYVRGQPGELVIIGSPGSSYADRCMIGVLTDEKLHQ